MKPRDQVQPVPAGIGQLLARFRGRADAAATTPSRPDVMGSRVLIAAGVLAAPFVFAGYVGLTMVLLLPLLGVRTMFPRTAPSTGPWYDGAARDRE